MPRNWVLTCVPGGFGYNNPNHIRVAEGGGRKFVEVKAPRKTDLATARGPYLEQVWEVSGTLSGNNTFGPANAGLPSIGVGLRQELGGGDYVRLGYGLLSPLDRTLWIMARGRQGGRDWNLPLLQVGMEYAYRWLKLRLRLVPTLQCFVEGELLGERSEGAWNIGGPLCVEMDVEEFGFQGEAAFSFYGVEAWGQQPCEAWQASDGGQRLRGRTISYGAGPWWGAPNYWVTQITRLGSEGNWEPYEVMSGVTHLSPLPQPWQRWYAVWFNPSDKAIYWGSLGGGHGVKILDGHYYPSATLLPEAGVAILVCYQEGALYAIRGTLRVGPWVSWEVAQRYTVAAGNVFPQRATVWAEASNRLRVLYLDRDYQLQERISDDLGSSWREAA